MVVTRRSRSNNNSPASNNQENDNVSGATAIVRGNSGGGSTPRGAPPPPPPPPPIIGNAPLHQPPVQHEQQQQQQQQQSGMAPVPEEVELLANNNNNGDDGANNNNNLNNANNNNIQQMAQPQPNNMQYLQVRIYTNQLLEPTRIHRRHHRQQQPVNPNMQQKRFGRSSTKQPRPTQQQQYHEGEIVKVLIPQQGFDSEKQLADCLNQASGSSSSNFIDNNRGLWQSSYDNELDDYSLDEYYEDRSKDVNVAGMFRESDRVFIPLSIIYTNPKSFIGEVLCIKRPPPPQKRQLRLPTTPTIPKQRSIFITFLEVLGIIVVLLASYKTYNAVSCLDYEYYAQAWLYKIEHAFFTLLNFPFYLFDMIIEFPLRELYRHGPSVIGWEGEPLPKICARITYHGDEQFWSRNIEECQRIYDAKEMSAMQVRKPIVVLCLLGVMFYMIKSIVAARALRNRQRIDPNMVETYRAIQSLVRQLRRAANGGR